MPAVTVDNILILPRVGTPQATAPSRPVLAVTTAPNDLGIAATTLLGIFAMLGLTWFILHSSARAAHPARS